MTWNCERVHETPLRPARSEEEYLLHQAALEWSLADCIVIQTAEDIQSRANWQARGLEPYHHQVQNLFTFCRRVPVTLLADDVGLGKTISAGLILSELMVRKRVSRALVLCPKILCRQWMEELEGKFGIAARDAMGEDLDQQLAGGTSVVVTTYESGADRLANLQTASFDMLILDEVHKLRNLYPGPKRPKMATKVRNALERRLFKYVVMLTATPVQNRLWDLFSLIDCLTVAKGHQNPLGSPDEFKKLYLMPGSDGRRLHAPNAESFRRILRQYIVRTRRDDAKLKFPDREVRLVKVDLSFQERGLMHVVATHIARLNHLQQISVAQAMMSSPQALATQLENMTERQPWLETAARQARGVANVCDEPTKLRHLLLLCDELRKQRPSDWRVVVFTLRKETQDVIRQALQRRGIMAGFVRGGEARQNQRAIEGLRADPPNIHVLVSTDAGAEGVNLQAANVVVNYDLPWNPMVVEQRIGRLQRLASEHRHVIIFNLVAAGSVEERIVARLMEKLQLIAHAIGDIESILESSAWNGDEGRFEQQIRDLVVKSLIGQDVEQATRLAQESIERARHQIDEGRAEMDRTLGRLDELHGTGPRMPKLERTDPAMPAREFVLRAKQAQGDTPVETSPGVFEVTLPGRAHEVVVFDETTAETISTGAVFMGNVKLYQPGKAEFERLVQHWVDRCGHHVYDLRRQTEFAAERLARTWCESMPEVSLLGCEVVWKESRFQGRVRVKAKASNGVDAYEKLISREFHPEDHHPVQASGSPSDLLLEEARPSDILSDYSNPIMKAVRSDRDVGEFCRFYEERRTTELAAAGNDPRLRHKVNEDFTPSIVPEIVGLQGIRYDEIRLSVRFAVQNEGKYEVVLRAVPASGQVLEEPARKACEHTGLGVPIACLETCELTGKLTLKHLLFTSEISGRRGLRDRVVTCQVTGKRVLDDEVAQSTVTGTVAVKSVLVKCEETGSLLLPAEADKSAVSGRRVRRDLLFPSEKPPHRVGLGSEFGRCEVTSKHLLTDELAQSAVSGKWVNRDLLLPSDRSGELALPEELITCQETGARLLPEETGMCVLTGKRVDARLLVRSEVSGAWTLSTLLVKCAATGKLALPAELQKCEVTGCLVLPQEMAVCTVTGKHAMLSQMVRCQQTGSWVLTSEAGKSDYSDKMVQRRLLRQSEKPPGRHGLSDEFGVCEVTGKHLLLDELGQSAVSGKMVDRELLRRSTCSVALALADELEQCQLTGDWALPSELATCSVTGKRAIATKMVRSHVSGRFVMPELALRSAASGKAGLPEEFGTCEVTGRRLLLEELDRSGVSGRLSDKRLLRHAACSGILALMEELEQCELTGNWALPSEMETCSVSGKRAIRSKMARSDVSGKYVLPHLAMLSAASKKIGLPEEFGSCEVTGRRLLLEELGCSAVSGRMVDRRLLRTSAWSGTLALAEEMERCSLTGGWTLPSELETCAVTGQRAIAGRMIRSDVSGRYVLPQHAVRSAVSGKMGLAAECVRCVWLERPILRAEVKACSLTGGWVAASLLNERGELIPVCELLNGRAKDAVEADDLIPRLRKLDDALFRGIRHVWVIRSPKGGKLAVCVELQSWLGIKVRHVVFLLRQQEFRIIGQVVVGTRHKNGFKIEEKRRIV